MPRNVFTALGSFLRKPLFGTVVVPHDATVDPSLFSESEYPVFCTKCSYCLRGLPDSRCPECGTTFERGQLLVWTYAVTLDQAIWRNARARKWCLRFIVAAITLSFLPDLYSACMTYFGNSSTVAPLSSPRERFVVLVVTLAALPFYFAALVIAIKAYPWRHRKRCRAILDAIKRATAGK